MKRFNVRVCGLLINQQQEILLSDEYRFGRHFTKFPGGGLEFGEGTVQCIEREAIEELGQEVEVLEHFYTTDFFQQSAFNPNDQVLMIYYKVALKAPARFAVTTQAFAFDAVEDAQAFRWVKLAALTEDDLTFPIDKKVVRLLKS